MATKLSSFFGGFRQWNIVWFGVGLPALAFAMVLYREGFNEAGVRHNIRLTAECGVVMFWLAFTASSVHQLLHNNFSGWQRANRRYFGISFAILHLIHLFFLVLLNAYFHPVFASRSLFVLFMGGTAYLFVFLMLLTSFPRFSSMLLPLQWRRLHTIGGWWIWVIFANSYISRAIGQPAYIPWGY